MIRRLPILPTLVVLIAAGIMVRLGFWQLDRLHQKEAMLASYAASDRNAPAVQIDISKPNGNLAYRQVHYTCRLPGKTQLVAGHNSLGQPGWGQVVVCSSFGIDHAFNHAIVLGWSLNPKAAQWQGGDVVGTLVPFRKSGITYPSSSGVYNGEATLNWYVVADPPLAGLQPNAQPDPRDIPNNHLAYAVQWFAFAGVALVIYGLAVRKRLGG